MSTAEFTNKLNRRHKAALCSTLICVGLIVLLGGAVRPTLGIGLLGLAFSWALGSDNRLVHWLFVICGLLLLVPAGGDAFLWPRQKPELIKSKTSIIGLDRDMVESANSVIAADTPLDCNFYSKGEERELRYSLSEKTEFRGRTQELQRLQAEGIFRHLMKEDWDNVLGGLLLLSSGLGLIIGVNPGRQNQTDASR